MVTTDDASAFGDTRTIFGGRVLPFGRCPVLALKSAAAVAKNSGRGGLLE